MSTELAIVREPAAEGGSSLVPSNMDQAIRLAELMSKGRLVPAHLQQSPADCLLVIEQAARWGLSPFAVAQSTSVIQGKLMYEGKLVAAVINARGDLAKRLDYEYSGEGDARAIRVFATCRGETTPRDVTVKLRDAKTNNKVWQTQPDQQLMYHGARVWARRHMPELMLGVWSPDEFPDAEVVDGPKARAGSAPPSASSAAPNTAPASEPIDIIEPPAAPPRRMASIGQVKLLNIELGKLDLQAVTGIADERGAKLLWLTQRLDREINSSKDVYADEIDGLIQAARNGEVSND